MSKSRYYTSTAGNSSVMLKREMIAVYSENNTSMKHLTNICLNVKASSYSLCLKGLNTERIKNVSRILSLRRSRYNVANQIKTSTRWWHTEIRQCEMHARLAATRRTVGGVASRCSCCMPALELFPKPLWLRSWAARNEGASSPSVYPFAS